MPAKNRVQFEAALLSRKVLYFACSELNTEEPHYFICLCSHPVNTVNLSCCTSQFATVKRLIERNKFPSETLVYIPKTDTDNPFKKDTYINCNEWFPYSIDELWSMYYNVVLTIIPDLLPLHSFEQILIGLLASPQIEDELKESLPDIDDL
jgi:hypothetical protein